MPIYALGALTPDIHPEAYVHPDAVVIGNVTLGAGASVWPGAVIRGDSGKIVVGARTSIQDGTIVHCTRAHDTFVGDDCVVGHLVHLEGCVIGNGTLIGSGSIVLNGASVGNGCLVAAGALVSPRTVVPDGARAMGVPARIAEGAAGDSPTGYAVQHYVDEGAQYQAELRRLD
jgi:carbonic anhydrase/acetyltransferase-like protein (isoleucine patch superfamily)